jgi:chromosome segregation protein
MKIKKLELFGFKSFVDKTVVHFDHDVLGIVGPNGCGKSNIVDAIRWCMGEQSAKHLRGRSMEDVIFGGSESRPGSDMAEVTLTFENNDPADVPLEFKDYAEIAVTRRLYRSGDSEYLINKTQVRLKDITDLFLGTGAGTRAYSIVEQGKIGLIVSAKPEDRRLLIEEAAGITKFKARKKQAERKMELTQQNLLRVGDIVAEIERNIGSLKRQAAKAERYVSYRNELEDLQLHEASHKLLELTGWIKLEASEVETCTAQADAARTDLVSREGELEGVRSDAHGAEEVLEQAHNAHFAADNEVRGEEAAIARAKDKIDAIRRREQQATGEAHEIAEQAARLAGERDVVAADVESLELEEASHAERVALEDDKLEELRGELQAAEATVNELRKVASTAQTSIAGAEAKLSGFDRRHAEMQTRAERMYAERDELQAGELEDAARESGLSEAVEDLRAGRVTSVEERERVETRLADLRREIVDKERALDEAKGELGRKRSRLHALLEMQARLEGVGAGVKALVAMKDDAVLGLVADRLEAPAELTQALAGLLGSRLEDVVVRDLDRGVELLEALARGKKGRATIVPLHPAYVAGQRRPIPDDDAIVGRLSEALRYSSEDEALVHSLVGDAIVVTDLAAARRLRAVVESASLVTLAGEVVHADGRVAGGQGEQVAAGMLESHRETRELAEEVARLDVVVTERLTAHQALRTAIGEATSALERARQKAHADELSLVTTEKDLRQAQGQLERTRKRLEVLTVEQSELSRALDEAKVEREAAAGILAEAQAMLADATSKLDHADALAASWREQVDAQRQHVTEQKIRVAGTREKLTAARGTVARLARSAEELQDRHRRLEEELVAGARTFGETAALLVAHTERLHAAIDTAHAASEALASARSVFEAFRAQLNERESQLKDLRTRVDETREALTSHEMALRERQISLQHLLEGVAEKFRGLNLMRVVGDYHMRTPPDDTTRARIQEIVHLLERMGSVNLDAVREHDEAEKRYTFYTEQTADLERALADLERAILQMNRESKRLFQETFDAVNLKFQEIFPRMFRGGRASLRMTNPEDLLETGIDILAQPPGKKLLSIELMSGGEKALTAVSLIFAIFQIKPSPFCILDEVDAPLDEANVARYNELVRSMTDRSQFILITHIKRTMQLVDVLYGVTMAESGVSRLVSVKLSDSVEKKKLPPVEQVAVA